MFLQVCLWFGIVNIENTLFEKYNIFPKYVFSRSEQCHFILLSKSMESYFQYLMVKKEAILLLFASNGCYITN